MSSEDVVCGGVKCPECCGPSCPVFSSLWKVKSQTSRRVALGPPAWCSHAHSSPLSPFVWGAWSSSDRSLPRRGSSWGLPPRRHLLGCRDKAHRRDPDPIWDRGPGGLGMPSRGPSRSTDFKAANQRAEAPATNHRPLGTQAGGILKPPLHPTSPVRKPFEEGPRGHTGEQSPLTEFCSFQ